MSTTTTRVARCQCGAERPSDPSLPFFEDRSAGTQNLFCKNCRYSLVAHELARELVRPNPHVCDRFEPMREGYETDSFYCGCGGWD